MAKLSRSLLTLLAALPLSANALPIDWNGTLGLDFTHIGDYHGVKKTTQDWDKTAEYQSAVFKLQPSILINDATSIKGELTRGYANNQMMGETSETQDHGQALFYNSTSQLDNSEFYVSKLYAELYSDTATYIIGRHGFNWGLGAFANSGDGVWDRFSFVRDGITMKVKLGYFKFEPFYSVPVSTGIGKDSKVTEYGISALYDNPERDIKFGVLFSQKKGDSNIKYSMKDNDVVNKEMDLKIVDVYFEQKLDNFNYAVEFPWVKGNLGHVYSEGTTTDQDAKAVLAKAEYTFNPSWSVKLDAGYVTGDDGKEESMDAMYLNPNYKIGKILFAYNPNGTDDNFFDAYVNNVQFASLSMTYKRGKLTLTPSVLYAKAIESAEKGKSAFNHADMKWVSNATYDQKDDYGTEFDIDFSYQWSSEVEIGGYAAYLMTGDYFKGAENAETENIMAFQLRTSIRF